MNDPQRPHLNPFYVGPLFPKDPVPLSAFPSYKGLNYVMQRASETAVSSIDLPPFEDLT